MTNKLLVSPGAILIGATRGGQLLTSPFLKDGQLGNDLYPFVTCYGMGQTGKLYLNNLATYASCNDDINPLRVMKRATREDVKVYWTIENMVKAIANVILNTAHNAFYPITGAFVKALSADGLKHDVDEATMTILLGNKYRIIVNGQVSFHEEYTDYYRNGSTLAFYLEMADDKNRERSNKWQRYAIRSTDDIISLMNRMKEIIADPQKVLTELGGLRLRLD